MKQLNLPLLHLVQQHIQLNLYSVVAKRYLNYLGKRNKSKLLYIRYTFLIDPRPFVNIEGLNCLRNRSDTFVYWPGSSMAAKRPSGDESPIPPAKKPVLAQVPLHVQPATCQEDLDIKVLQVNL